MKEHPTQLELLPIIHHQINQKAIHKISFHTMLLPPPNSPFPHPIPAPNKIKRADFLLFDLRLIIDRYCSHITPTLPFPHIS
ncbi:M24 family metallopeptidase, partial [Bacillus mycoides]|uniref:M24 family metallopeptidase n=1 Tax=Bacillus mycoides TaxID=1405 RepID=UPI003CC80AC1